MLTGRHGRVLREVRTERAAEPGSPRWDRTNTKH